MKVYTRHFYFLVFDAPAEPGGARLEVIEVDFELQRDGAHATAAASHMLLARKYPAIEVTAVKLVCQRDTSRLIHDPAPEEENLLADMPDPLTGAIAALGTVAAPTFEPE